MKDKAEGKRKGREGAWVEWGGVERVREEGEGRRNGGRIRWKGKGKEGEGFG